MCACIETKCCDLPHIIESEGVHVCKNCGIVDSAPYFDQRETFTKDHEGRYVRVSERIRTESVYPLSTISPYNKDYKRCQISCAQVELFQRLRTIDRYYISNKRRNMVLATQIRRRIMSSLGFTDPKKISWQICQWVAKTGFSQGRILEATTAAAVYVAAREQNFPVTYEELCALANVRINHLRHLVSIYLAGRPIGTHTFPVKLTREKFFLPNRAIRKLCEDLHYPPRIAMLAEQLAQSVEARLPTGARPETKAAVFVNATCGGSISWNHLSRAVGVQVPSLKEYWNRVESVINKILHVQPSYEQKSELNIC